jgi:predicted RNA polymerase sigma factor
MKWIGGTHTMRYHAHYHTQGLGHVYQQRFKLTNWTQRVNEALSDAELEAVRRCAHRGQPYGDETWTESVARRMNLESTMRPRGRPRKTLPTRKPK